MSGSVLDLALRPMRWWHLPAVLELEAELFGPEAWSPAAFWAELAEPDTRYYVVAVEPAADPDGRLVGYGGLAVYDDEAHVLTLGVTGARQRAGVGALLLRDLLAAAAERRAAHVLLEVGAENESAQRLYRRYGFVPVGLRRGYYQPSGADAVVMRRG